jgi:hypothetical protein
MHDGLYRTQPDVCQNTVAAGVQKHGKGVARHGTGVLGKGAVTSACRTEQLNRIDRYLQTWLVCFRRIGKKKIGLELVVLEGSD